ncbi:D-aminoacyl-tRNA deacylase [Selaginella moellendorffii]|nr:D-aminoacyl-tRNA deacylase [Selaginella moellendorffii]|eukprot:XP_002986689.2 D-aminoacyl-tRNA deacylase [Selaginella moellendorffii]
MKRMVTLLVATTTDPASINPASALLFFAPNSWTQGRPLQGFKNFAMGNVRLLQLTGSIVGEDNLDHRWESHSGEHVTEIIFMSKHAAVSGKPSLTVHPIGVPHMLPSEKPLAGGKPGFASPPCPRIAPWLRLLKEVAVKHELVPEFEITLEATHHGPEVDAPAMFVEIGSSDGYWSRLDAAQAIATVFWQGLGLDGGTEVGKWTEAHHGENVLLGLGGGHYVPRHMDVIENTGSWVGHLLSGYSLPMDEPSAETKKNANEELFLHVTGTWKDAIRESFRKTQAAFPGGKVMAHLDAKSLKSWQRSAILSFLACENIPVGKPHDFAAANEVTASQEIHSR